MRPSTRTTLLILATLTVPFGLFLWWTEADLRPRLEDQVEESLAHQARLIAFNLGDTAFSDSLADALGRASGSRITLIDDSGTVVGDSQVSPDRLLTVENHADRPEVAAAMRGETGASIRASETVSLRLLYVAVPAARGVLRVSVPLSRVDALVTRSRQWVMAGGLITIVLVGLLGGRLGSFWLRPVTHLQETLAAIGRGERGRRVRFSGGGALSAVGRSVDDMASRIDERFEELSSERSDLRNMFDELEDGVAQIDREGQVLRANRAFETWIGRTGILGERIGSLLRDPGNLDAIERGLNGEAAANESTIGRHTILVTAKPDDRGALVVLRDLTRMRHLESIRTDFVANVSHELKTPLTNIHGFGEALADDDALSEGQRSFARRIVVNAVRMQALVDDLLDLSKIESGVWQPEIESLLLGDVIREVWTSFDKRPSKMGVRLDPVIPDDLEVQADPDALRQILRNLLDNSLRYAPPGSTIAVETTELDDAHTISVVDAGPGISGMHHERVFERFYRVDAARSREAGGTGLGLSIVKHLVVAHGGEVGIESEVGRGTRVWFTLPSRREIETDSPG